MKSEYIYIYIYIYIKFKKLPRKKEIIIKIIRMKLVEKRT
jgi:hypothetical protein